MRSTVFFALCFYLYTPGCSSPEQQDAGNPPVPASAEIARDSSVTNFFPVTTFLKGQIAEIKSGGVNPLKKTKKGLRSDSAWMKMEELDAELAEFLHPLIDTANLVSSFEQKSFLDQTVNAFTFTYDPKATLPDSMELRHWDVYVNPETNKVTRIYIIKKKAGNRQLQLTWQNGQKAKIVSISIDAGGKPVVEHETSITWNFDN
ncbi:MAG: hypothetical protein WAT19_07815 [Ferruginibacter sp.]